jgi:hypothetical protein
MLTALSLIAMFIGGYYLGRKVGIAETMLRVQGLIQQLQEIEKTWNNTFKQWNEDNL